MTFDELMLKVRPVSSETALSDEEAQLLFECVTQIPSGAIAIEIGCQLGRSSVLIANVAHMIRFHTIHIDPHTMQGEMAAGWIGHMKKFCPDDSTFTALYMRTDQAESILEKLGPYHFAYIDGDHEYPGVMTDLRVAAQRVVVGGMICCHDYGRESLPGVWKAVNEYMESGDWEQIRVAGTMGAWRRVR